MSEIFTNYKVSVTPDSSTEFVIVPRAVSRESNYNGDVRTEGSVCQIHSLYISNNYSSYISPKDSNTDILDYLVVCSLYIKDGNSKFYIAHNVNVPPSSPFYIEKNITLKSTQSLCVMFNSASKAYNTTITASAVDIA